MNHQQIESVLPSFTGLKIIDSRILLTAQLRLKSGIKPAHCEFDLQPMVPVTKLKDFQS